MSLHYRVIRLSSSPATAQLSADWWTDELWRCAARQWACTVTWQHGPSVSTAWLCWTWQYPTVKSLYSKRSYVL